MGTPFSGVPINTFLQMLKKILIFFVLCLLLVAGVGFYNALKYRNLARQQRSNAKAPQSTITFVEGWSNKDIANYLEKQGVVSSADFLAAIKNYNTSAYDAFLPEQAKGNLEGFIFPDTYFIPKTASAGESLSDIIIGKALDNFSQKISPAMKQQAAAKGMSLYQIMTLASVIEKESGSNQDDKKMIAGVFYNRLQAGMPLQSDATVSYVTGHSPITADDINVDSPYNTYKYKGLPAGPICNPSLNSIMAALYPTDSSYFYFLTIPGTGRAVFAVTYEDHLKNKAKYLQ
jgi:UPF0755 protein